VIPKETVDEIIETARVEEVVGEFVSLKKRGANLLGLCPFHNEKTPSFTVSPAKGIYKCFGCGKAGSAVSFMMDHEHYTYPEALKYLADKYNIELEEEELSADEIQAANEKESLFIVTQFAAEYFSDQLWKGEEGRSVGLSYFKERGFLEESIEKFKLGYSPDDWDSFTKTALDKGYKLDFLEKTGLSIVKGEKRFDRFKGRVIFPIQNISGRVIGFGGRTLSADKKTAKYLNSPESEIYHKSKVLYGLNFAKKSIIAEDLCYLVEGYTDVISFHQNEVKNVVSSSGTSLTEDQIRLIKRYTSNITILFDGDEAGIKAAFRGIDMILEAGMNVKVLAFPEGEDPDSYAKSHSSTELTDFLIENAVDFIRFKTKLLLKETDDDPIKKAALIKEIVNSIALIPEPISRSVYLQECSKLMEIDEASLLSELNKIRRKKITQNLRQKQQEKNEDQSDEEPQIKNRVADSIEEKIQTEPLEFQENDLIRTLIKYGNNEINIPIAEQAESNHEEEKEMLKTTVMEYLISELDRDQFNFKNTPHQKIYLIYKNALGKGKIIAEKELIAHHDQEVSSFIIQNLIDKYSLSVNWEEKHKILTIREEDRLPSKVHKGICSWRLYKVNEMIKENQEKLKQDPDKVEQIINEIKQLLEAKKILANELGRIVLH